MEWENCNLGKLLIIKAKKKKRAHKSKENSLKRRWKKIKWNETNENAYCK